MSAIAKRPKLHPMFGVLLVLVVYSLHHIAFYGGKAARWKAAKLHEALIQHRMTEGRFPASLDELYKAETAVYRAYVEGGPATGQIWYQVSPDGTAYKLFVLGKGRPLWSNPWSGPPELSEAWDWVHAGSNERGVFSVWP